MDQQSSIAKCICHGFSGWQALTTTACYLLSQMHPVLYQLTDVWLFGTQTGIEFPRMRNYFEMHVTQKSSYLHKICERLLLPWWTAALRILSWIKVIYFLVAEGKMRKRKGPESRPKLSKANCWLANICPVPMQAPPGKCSLPKFWKGGRQHCWIPGWKRSTLYTWLGRRELQECHCSSTPTSGSCFHPFSLHTAGFINLHFVSRIFLGNSLPVTSICFLLFYFFKYRSLGFF